MFHLSHGFQGATDPSAWISDDRILVCLSQASGGVSELLFHGPQPQAGNTYLLRDDAPTAVGQVTNLPHALTWGLEVNTAAGWQRIPHRFDNATLHPHACETVVVEGDVSLATWTGLSDGALIIVTHVTNTGGAPIEARWTATLNANALWRRVHGSRDWRGPEFVANSVVTTSVVPPPPELGVLRASARDRLHTLDWINVPGFADLHLDTLTHLWLLSTGAVAYTCDGSHHTLTTLPFRLAPGERAEPRAFVCLCGGDEGEMAERATRLREQWPQRMAQQQARYSKVLDHAPRLSLPGFPGLETAFRLAPGHAEAAKVGDTGSIRASCGGDYFVWGWDSLVSGHEFYRWGDTQAMRDMARFFETHRAEDGSIPHRYDNQLGVLQATGYDFNTQLFISLVYHTFAQTGDAVWLADRYPLVREMFLRMAGQTDARGLFACLGMYPDAPEKLGRAPDHFIAEEQGFWYSVCRMMERTARQMGDGDTATRAHDIGRVVGQHFLPAFFDPQAGFLTDSIGPDGARNGTYPLWALMAAHTPDGIELLHPHWQALADWIEARLMTANGINMAPDDDPHYGTETVTTSCWFMHFDVYVMRLLRRARRGAAIARWLDMAERLFGEYLCIPELVRTGAAWVQDGRHLEAGQRWQMFAAMGWYRALVEGVVGVEYDIGGLTALPADVALDTELRGHHFGQSIWDVTVRGRGDWWDSIVLNGRPILGSCKLPVDCRVEGRHDLHLTRSSATPTRPMLMAAPGAAVLDSGYTGEALHMTLAGSGPASVRLWSPNRIIVEWNGRAMGEPARGDIRFDLDLRGEGVLMARPA